jgi:peroxiredoxin Q/BCP
MAKLHRNEVVILGASPDSLNSHKRFHEKQGLNFPLLSDPDKRIAGLYGAYGEKKMYGKITKGIITHNGEQAFKFIA